MVHWAMLIQSIAIATLRSSKSTKILTLLLNKCKTEFINCHIGRTYCTSTDQLKAFKIKTIEANGAVDYYGTGLSLCGSRDLVMEAQLWCMFSIRTVYSNI